MTGGPLEVFRTSWNLPLASFSLEIDPLSAFFLLPTLGLAALAAVYGVGYLSRDPERGRAGIPWMWTNVLIASMALVVTARNAVLFLFAWEIMTLSSYFLVTRDHHVDQVRQAGRIYLIAAHVGTAFLLVLFLSLGGPSGSLDFDQFSRYSQVAGNAGAIFLFALVGFGVKAGLVPLHVWLPEAHPAAPSHVSALMSGSMITMGIYGLLRTLTFLGPPPPWWGWTLLVIGVLSGVIGVLYALAQQDLKRLLAYSSVENIGLVAAGLGLGLLGLSRQSSFLAALGFGSALLHLLNHAAFKGLLFFGAGAVLHATGTAKLERLGGLLRRMPWTGAAFATGAMAVSGLPPFNGFAGEFLLFRASFGAVAELRTPEALAGAIVVGGLGLISGLAAACFARAFGIAFLGEPRSDDSRDAHEAKATLVVPMAVLAVGCLVLGLGAPGLVPLLSRVLATVTAAVPLDLAPELRSAQSSLLHTTVVAAIFIGLLVAVAVVRRLLLAGRPVTQAGTWDCGYAAPSPRAQYTASSFGQPLIELFAPMLGTRLSALDPAGPFPKEARLATATPDSFRERVFRPISRELDRQLSRFRQIQEGRVQIYVLYIMLTLLALLVYQFLGTR